MNLSTGFSAKVSIVDVGGQELYTKKLESVADVHEFVRTYGQGVESPSFLKAALIPTRLTAWQDIALPTFTHRALHVDGNVRKVFACLLALALDLVTLVPRVLVMPLAAIFRHLHPPAHHKILELIGGIPEAEKAIKSGEVVIKLEMQDVTVQRKMCRRYWFFNRMTPFATDKGKISGTVPVALVALPRIGKAEFITKSKRKSYAQPFWVEDSRCACYTDCLRLALVLLAWKHDHFGKDAESLWMNDYFAAVGNASASEAQVFCFGEMHTDDLFRKATAKFINDRYRPGDIVLVEGTIAGKRIEPKDNLQSSFLHPGAHVQGWEPQDFMKVMEWFGENVREQYDRLIQLYEGIKSKLPEGTDYSDADLQPLEAELQRFVKEYKQLADFFGLQKNLFKLETDLQKAFIRLKKKEGIPLVFLIIICEMLVELENCREEALYRHQSKDALERIAAYVPTRNASLVGEIQKYATNGRRVFVIAGKSHFLSCNLMSRPSNEKEELTRQRLSASSVREALSRYKFVVLSSKQAFGEENLAKLNPDLLPQPLAAKA